MSSKRLTGQTGFRDQKMIGIRASPGLPLQARPPAKPARYSPKAKPMADGQGEAAWGTSGQAQLECWDNAIFGLMVKFVLTIKLKIADILLKTNLPTFHHSILEESV